MPSYNKLLFMGHLTRTPELKMLPSQTQIATFGMACNRKYKTAGGEDREEVCFLDCTAFGKTAEILAQYVVKGDPLFIDARLKYETWDDKNGTGKRHKLSAVVDSFQFIKGKRDGEQGGDSEPAPAQQSRKPSQRPAVSAPFGDEQEFSEDSIPFFWSGRMGQPL